MIKSKIILLCLAILFIADFLQAKTFVSFNGRYTNLVYGGKINLWEDKNKFTFEQIKSECEKQPDNPDVWYVQGYYWLHRVNNRKKAGECYKKSMTLAQDAFKPKWAYIDIIRKNNGAEELYSNLTSSFYTIKSLNNTLNWSWQLNYFSSEDTNQLKKLYFLIEENIDKVPGYKYALGKCALQAEKYEIAFELFEMELEETNNRTEKKNILNGFKLSYKYADNPKLMAEHNRILKKYLSPYKYAVQKIEDLRPKHNNPELYILTSNAFGLAKNQRERIIAINDLTDYCYNTNQKEIKNFIDKIVEEKYVNPVYASMLIRNMNTINETNDLHSYCVRVIDRIPEKLNAINNLINAVHSDNNGRKKPEADKYVLNLIVNKFPKNYSIINFVAEKYGEYGCCNEELDCREKMLALTDNKDLISKTKARIAELKIKSGQQIDGKKFIAENIKKTKNNSATAKVVSTFYLSKGKTNAALDVLLKCAENTDFPNDSRAAIDAVLNTEWGRLEEKALDSLFVLVKNNYSALNSFAGEIMWKYFDAGFEGKAIDTFTFIAKNNDRPSKFEKIVKRLNATILVNRIISEKITNSYVLLRMSDILNADNNKPEAYKLRNYFIKLPNKDSRKYYEATEIMEYAFRKGDTNLCYDIVDKIDGFFKEKLPNKYLPDNLAYYMLKLNMRDKYNSWITILHSNATDKTRNSINKNAAKWYMRAGFTNQLLNLVKGNNLTNMTTGMLFDTLSIFEYLKTTNLYRVYIDEIGSRISNNHMIVFYGSKYLSGLNKAKWKFGLNYEDSVTNLLYKWFYLDEIPIQVKAMFLYNVPGNKKKMKNEFLDCLMVNKSELDASLLNFIAKMYIQIGMTNNAIDIYNFALNKPETENQIKLIILLKLTKLYIKKENFVLATNSLDRLEQLDSDYNYGGWYSTVGDLYAKLFIYDKAVDYYIEAINTATQVRGIGNYVRKIHRISQENLEIDFNMLAESNVENNKNSFRLFGAAAFFLINNNTVEAKKYFGEVIAKISDNKEKYKLWKLWCRLAQKNNNDVLELEARKKLFQFGDKSELVHINELFKRMINYKKLIAYNTKILNSKFAEPPGKIIINIACKELFDTYLHFGDTNTAWKMVAEIYDYNYLLSIAERLDKIDEIAPKLVENIQNGNSDEIAYLARRLGNYYNKKNDTVSMQQLISIIMEKTPVFKPSSYKEISNFYLAVGMTNNAIKILEKYGETANKTGKDYVKRRIEVLRLMTK